jgi:hypothetical protein
MTRPEFHDLSESHKRSIGTACLLLDEMLCEFEQFARGREVRSVFYVERNRLSPRQKERLLAEIQRVRDVLRELKETLGLRVEPQDIVQRVWGSSSAFWEVLVETESKHLRRYGKMPQDFGQYLDPRVETLIQHLRNISRIAGGRQESGD